MGNRRIFKSLCARAGEEEGGGGGVAFVRGKKKKSELGKRKTLKPVSAGLNGKEKKSADHRRKEQRITWSHGKGRTEKLSTNTGDKRKRKRG